MVVQTEPGSEFAVRAAWTSSGEFELDEPDELCELGELEKLPGDSAVDPPSDPDRLADEFDTGAVPKQPVSKAKET